MKLTLPADTGVVRVETEAVKQHREAGIAVVVELWSRSSSMTGGVPSDRRAGVADAHGNCTVDDHAAGDDISKHALDQGRRNDRVLITLFIFVPDGGCQGAILRLTPAFGSLSTSWVYCVAELVPSSVTAKRRAGLKDGRSREIPQAEAAQSTDS